MTQSEAELGYLAGVIDGKGSIIASVVPRDGYTAVGVRVNVCNTDRRLIDWLAERFPGRTSSVDRSAYENQKDVWRWDADGGNGRVILAAALPYLVLKREQADLALRLMGLTRNHGRAGYPPGVMEECVAIARRIQQLNKKGRAA